MVSRTMLMAFLFALLVDIGLKLGELTRCQNLTQLLLFNEVQVQQPCLHFVELIIERPSLANVNVEFMIDRRQLGA